IWGRRSPGSAACRLPKATLRARSSPTAMASPSSTDSQNPIRATRDGSTIWGRRSIVLATYWLPKVTLRARSSPTAMASPSSTDSQNPILATRDGSTIWGVVLPDRRRAGCPRRPCGRAQVLPRWLRHQISAGTLQIGNGGTTGSVAGNIVDNAALVFNRSNALTYGGGVMGTDSP